MKLIIGLGNPGKEYEKTWHNVGFQALDEIKKDEKENFSDLKLIKKYKAEISEGKIIDEKVILVKPQTYMNLSGQSVLAVASFYKIKPEDIWIIHDEFDLPLGQIRISKNSSAGGHKGIQSIINQTGTKEFVRFRIGIKPIIATKIPAEKFVLKKISKENDKILRPVLQTTVLAIKEAILNSPEKAMNKFN